MRTLFNIRPFFIYGIEYIEFNTTAGILNFFSTVNRSSAAHTWRVAAKTLTPESDLVIDTRQEGPRYPLSTTAHPTASSGIFIKVYGDLIKASCEEVNPNMIKKAR
ncbi:MAG: hypothetical protein AB1724_05125 [Thermodesulfobacteriota bacterium]